MKRLIEYSAAHYIAVLVGILCVTLLTAYYLPRLYIDITPEGLMAADTPALRIYGHHHPATA